MANRRWTSDRPLMAPVDSDQLFKLVWELLDSREAFEADVRNGKKWAAYIAARAAFIDFTTAHPYTFLDLIERGKCSDWRREYTAPEEARLVSGAADPEQAWPYYYDQEEGRIWTAREMWHAPRKEEKSG